MLFLKPGKLMRVFAALLMLLGPSSAWAVDYTWTGTGVINGDWNAADNWDDFVNFSAPGDAGVPGVHKAFFNGAAPGTVTLNTAIDAGSTFSTLGFSNSGDYTINNLSLPFANAGTITQSGTGNNVVNTQITGTNLTTSVTGGSLTLGNTANTFTSHAISGGGTLKAITGGGSSGLGSGSVSLNGGTLALSTNSSPVAGLLGQYWQTGSNPDQNWFNSMAAFNAHFGSIAPTATSQPGAFPNSFDFSNAGYGGNVPFGEAGISIGADTVAAHWSGLYTPTATGNVDFFTRSDDGSMLFIDGNLVVSNNFYQGATTRSGSFNFTDTNPHQIDVLFYEGGGGAGVSASQGSDGNYIPKSQLSYVVPTTANLTNTVNVTQNSTIDTTSVVGSVATLGATTVTRGAQLSLNGNLTLPSLTATGGAGAVTLNPAAASTLNVPSLSDGGAATSFVKSGAGTVNLTSAASPGWNAGTSLNIQGGTVKALSSGAGATSIGSTAVTLSGGTLNISGTTQLLPGLNQSWYVDGGFDINNPSSGSAQGTNILTGPLNFTGDADFLAATASTVTGVQLSRLEQFQFKWNGTFRSDGGNYVFGVGNAGAAVLDDDMRVFIDGVQVYSRGCCGSGNGASTPIAAGDHSIAITFAEGGGGNTIGATFSHNGGPDQIINPSVQNNTFLYTGFGVADFSANAIHVTANSGISVGNNTPTAPALVGAVTIDRGTTLTTTGNVKAPTVTAGAGAGGTVGLGSSAGTFTIPSLSDAGSANTTFVKSGAGTVSLTGLGSNTYSTNAAFNVQAGTLLATNNAAGLSSLKSGSTPVPVTLSGGTLQLNSSAGFTVTQAGGLTGSYYNLGGQLDSNKIATYSSLINDPVFANPTSTAFTPQVDFPDNGGNPFVSVAPLLNADNIAARWVGAINISAADAASPIYFRTNSDDGTTLFIDGVKVVDNNFYQGNTARMSAPITLSEGYHEIAGGFYEGGGGANVGWGWVHGGAIPADANSGLFQTIPSSVFAVGISDAANYLNPVHVTANGSINNSGSAVVNMAGLTMDAGQSLQFLGRDVNFTGTSLNGNATFNSGAGTTGVIAIDVAFRTVSTTNLGPVTDNGINGTLTKTGVGSVVFNNASNTLANTDIVISGGQLVVGADGALDSAKSVSIASGGTLELRVSDPNFTTFNWASGGRLYVAPVANTDTALDNNYTVVPGAILDINARDGAGAISGLNNPFGIINHGAGSVIRASNPAALTGFQLALAGGAVNDAASIAAGEIVQLNASNVTGLTTAAPGAIFEVWGSDTTQDNMALNGHTLTNDGSDRTFNSGGSGVTTNATAGSKIAASGGTRLNVQPTVNSTASTLTLGSTSALNGLNKDGTVVFNNQVTGNLTLANGGVEFRNNYNGTLGTTNSGLINFRDGAQLNGASVINVNNANQVRIYAGQGSNEHNGDQGIKNPDGSQLSGGTFNLSGGSEVIGFTRGSWNDNNPGTWNNHANVNRIESRFNLSGANTLTGDTEDGRQRSESFTYFNNVHLSSGSTTELTSNNNNNLAVALTADSGVATVNNSDNDANRDWITNISGPGSVKLTGTQNTNIIGVISGRLTVEGKANLTSMAVANDGATNPTNNDTRDATLNTAWSGNAGTLAINPGATINVNTSGTVNTLIVNSLLSNVTANLNNGSTFTVGSTLGGKGEFTALPGVVLSPNLTVAPGDSIDASPTGTFTYYGNFTADAGSTLQIQLGANTGAAVPAGQFKPANAGDYDKFVLVDAGGGATYTRAGTLALSLVNGFQPHTGDLFTDVFSAATLAGGFSSITGLNLGNNLLLNPISSATGLSFLAAQIGDANLDRSTNFSDLSKLLLGYNQPGDWTKGDFNDDKVVNFSDLSNLLLHYNQTTPLVASLGAPASVPEPSSMILLGLGAIGLGMAGYRARRRQA